MIRKIIYALSLACIVLLAAGCSKDDDNNQGQSTEKHNKPSWVVDGVAPIADKPLWTPIADETLASSMTVTVTLDGYFPKNDITSDDMLQAYSGDLCLGVAQASVDYDMVRFYLYVLPPKAADKTISFAYYNAKNKKIYYWTDMLRFENDNSYGTYKEPYVLRGSVSSCYAKKAYVLVSFANTNGIDLDNDEFALFVGDKCHKVVPKDDFERDGDNGYFFFTDLPVKSMAETFTIRRYSFSEDKVYTSDEYKMGNDGTVIIENIVWH